MDWDVHHGNGTQHPFEADPRCSKLPASRPRHLLSGDRPKDRNRERAGQGVILNFLFPPDSHDQDYIGVVDGVCAAGLEPSVRTA